MKLGLATPARTRISQAVGIIMGLGTALMALPAQAFETKLGDYDLTVNSTVSIGTSIRAENRDRALFSGNNADSSGTFGTGLSNTTDDGNLNFDRGDAFSTVVRGFHDVTLKKQNYGFFGRVRWFYDYTLNNDKVFHGHEPTNNNINAQGQRVPQRLNDSGFHPTARFDGIDLLDAYGFLDTKVGDKPLNLRLGRQVISWGESTLITNPISGLNSFDVSALRRPGVNLKEAFLPSEMLYANLGVADNTSLEGFYQLQWRKTAPEGCGTFFSSNDFAADGCGRLAFAGGLAFDRTQGLPAPFPLRIGDGAELNGAVPVAGQQLFNQGAAIGGPQGAALQQLGGLLRNAPPISRSIDRQPDDGGQFGLALRHYAPSLDIEFGGYFLNYHSRLPLISFQAGSAANPATGNALPFVAAGAAGVPVNQRGSYFVDYPENITTVGFSLSTNIKGTAVAGQVTHTRDTPIQYNANDLLSAGLLGAGAGTPLGQRVGNSRPGDRINGFELFDVTQVQGSFISQFDRILGASRYVVLGEAAAVMVNNLPEIRPGQRFGRNPVFGTVNGTEGYVTDFSWGYRLRATGTYNNVIGDVDLLPTISWAHDVDGWSPEPGQVFNEGRKALGLSLGFEFNPNTSAAITYTTFSNSAKFDPLRDRDFISLTASHSF